MYIEVNKIKLKHGSFKRKIKKIGGESGKINKPKA